MRSREQDRAIAVHESSHAIVARHLGFVIECASIDPGQTSRGVECEGRVEMFGDLFADMS